MANRHKAQAAFKKGGRVVYSGAGSNVEHEAEEHKRGGHAHKHGGSVHGHKGHHRVAKRASGGRVGADKAPFSSAHIAAPAAHNPHPK